MADVTRDRCSGCRRLFSLCAECIIISSTVLHVLMTTVELLVHLEIISVPEDSSVLETDQPGVTDANIPATVMSTVASSTYDPGGSRCETRPNHHSLEVTIQVLRYATLVISGIFFVEMFCKAVYLGKLFFKDKWQMFDMGVVTISLGVEIAFFLQHENILCYSTVTEVAAYVIILRLWRIPRACNIRKKEYRDRLDAEIRYLRQTKMETDLKYKHMEQTCHKHEAEVQKLKTILKKAQVGIEDEKVPNGKGPPERGFSGVINAVFHERTQDSAADHRNGAIPGHASLGRSATFTRDDVKDAFSDGHSELERNDSDVSSKAKDSGIDVKDSFRGDKDQAKYEKSYKSDNAVFDDSDSEAQTMEIKEVRVQIEETIHQKQLPSISRSMEEEEEDEVVLGRNVSEQSAAAFDNSAYEDDDLDGTKTYRSIDGTPMTDL